MPWGAPFHPDIPAAEGGVQRTPFMGSRAETQGTRRDTGDEAGLADVNPRGWAQKGRPV